jgi:hypothetical protein
LHPPHAACKAASPLWHMRSLLKGKMAGCEGIEPSVARGLESRRDTHSPTACIYKHFFPLPLVTGPTTAIASIAVPLASSTCLPRIRYHGSQARRHIGSTHFLDLVLGSGKPLENRSNFRLPKQGQSPEKRRTPLPVVYSGSRRISLAERFGVYRAHLPYYRSLSGRQELRDKTPPSPSYATSAERLKLTTTKSWIE